MGLFAVAAAYLAQAWRIIFSLRIGPVVAVIDAAHGHGIHAGDFLGVACGFAALVFIATGAVLLDDALGTAARLVPAAIRTAAPAHHRTRPRARRSAAHDLHEVAAPSRGVRHAARPATRSRRRHAWAPPAVAAV